MTSLSSPPELLDVIKPLESQAHEQTVAWGWHRDPSVLKEHVIAFVWVSPSHFNASYSFLSFLCLRLWMWPCDAQKGFRLSQNKGEIFKFVLQGIFSKCFLNLLQDLSIFIDSCTYFLIPCSWLKLMSWFFVTFRLLPYLLLSQFSHCFPSWTVHCWWKARELYVQTNGSSLCRSDIVLILCWIVNMCFHFSILRWTLVWLSYLYKYLRVNFAV